MTHDRKLVLAGVGVVPGRLRQSGPILGEVRDEVERLMIESNFLESAPFRWISLLIRYGDKTVLDPVYERISKTHGDLPIVIELAMEKLRALDRPKSRDELKRVFALATLDAVLAVAEKYGLPSEALKEKRGDVYDSAFRPPPVA